MAIIESLLDTDYYKFTMGNLAYCQFPDMHVKYRFKLRGPYGIEPFNLREKNEVIEELEKWCDLKFTSEEIAYLAGRELFDKSYLEFLSKYSPNIDHFDMDCSNQLGITVEGPWCQTIFWEIAVLSIISEIHSRRYSHDGGMPNDFKPAHEKLRNNIDMATAAAMWWADFGTRRRFSRKWHDGCVSMAKEYGETFIGTSNVYLAKKYDVKPIGTMAHEYLSIGQAIAHPLDAQREMLQRWSDQYRGNLGIALTDITGVDSFIRDFDYYFGKLYDGVRHDSGDPYWWADKMIAHYQHLGIDPKEKAFVFSDGLDFPKAVDLCNHYRDRTRPSAGIGTKFTNDTGNPALQIVMKIIEVNGRPVAKVPDSPGKGMCEDEDYVNYLKKLHKMRE